MNTIAIVTTDGEVINEKRIDVTPSGARMFNTSIDQLKKVLDGDGRDLYVYRNYETLVNCIPSSKIKDILIDGVSIRNMKLEIHQCGVWCNQC